MVSTSDHFRSGRESSIASISSASPARHSPSVRPSPDSAQSRRSFPCAASSLARSASSALVASATCARRLRWDRDGEGGEEFAATRRCSLLGLPARVVGVRRERRRPHRCATPAEAWRRALIRAPARSAAPNRPSVRHSPGCSGGRQRRRRWPSRGQFQRVRGLAGPDVIDGGVGCPVRDVRGHGDQEFHERPGQVPADVDPAATCCRSIFRAAT